MTTTTTRTGGYGARGNDYSYVTPLIGTPLGKKIPLSNCQSTRNNWEQYGTNPPKELEIHVQNLKKLYQDGGCGKDVLLEKCKYLEDYIQNLRDDNEKNAYLDGESWIIESNLKTIAEKEAELKELDCAKKLEEYKQIAVKSTIDKYTTIDEERIGAESKYQANVRIFIGASVLVLALTIILVNRK